MSSPPSTVSNSPLAQAVERLRLRKGHRLKDLGRAPVDRVSVRRFREALGLLPDPDLGVPPMLVHHLLRPDVDVSVDVRPHETIDSVLDNPVNGGTEITLDRLLRLDETISGELLLFDAYLRDGKSGPMAVVVTESRYSDAQGQRVASVRSTMIYRGVKP